MIDVTDFCADLLKRFAGNRCVSLPIAGGTALYAVSASALTADPSEYGALSANIRGFFPAGHERPVVNNGAIAQPSAGLPSLGRP